MPPTEDGRLIVAGGPFSKLNVLCCPFRVLTPIPVVTGSDPFLTRLILGFWNRHGAPHSGPITRLSLADSTTSFVT